MPLLQSQRPHLTLLIFSFLKESPWTICPLESLQAGLLFASLVRLTALSPHSSDAREEEETVPATRVMAFDAAQSAAMDVQVPARSSAVRKLPVAASSTGKCTDFEYIQSGLMLLYVLSQY